MKAVLSAFSPVVAVDRKAAEPLHRQIYDAYRAMIIGRNLGAGQQIPSTRTLASELRISRIPVLTAYAQLLAEGYFETRVGAGTFVCSSLPDQLTSAESRATKLNGVRSGPRPVARRSLLLRAVRHLPRRFFPQIIRRDLKGVPKRCWFSPWRISHLTDRVADARKQVGSLLMKNQTGGRQDEKDTECVCFVVYAACYVEPGRQCPGSSNDLDGLDQR
jgi:DNA-binding transcriptional regulator YhcF (GntR family)